MDALKTLRLHSRERLIRIQQAHDCRRDVLG
jgi:hypothetical protein